MQIKKNHIFDYIIIGSGITGLISALGLKKKGFDVLLLDDADFPGGNCRSVYSPVGLVDNGLKHIPLLNNLDFDAIGAGLSFLLDEKLNWIKLENSPITFANKELKRFVGFGDYAPDFHKQLSYYLSPEKVVFSIENQGQSENSSMGELLSHMSRALGDLFLPKSMVTQFHFDASNNIEYVVVNGVKNISALNYVYCGSPKSLTKLMDGSGMPAKFKQKLAKATYWTTICLDFFHGKIISDRREMHMLNGTTNDEIGPCVGLFHAPVEKAKSPGSESLVDISGDGIYQHSQWLTYLDEESSRDTEAMGAILKKIKKQIKRAYPEAFDNLVSERIAVLPFDEVEMDARLSENFQIPSGPKNLYLPGGAWANHSNLVGDIFEALRFIQSVEGLQKFAASVAVETSAGSIEADTIAGSAEINFSEKVSIL